VLAVSVIFAMFGQGGGSIYTPVLVLLGYATLISISTSLFLNLITALSASIVYYKKAMVNLKLGVVFIPGIALGSFLGGIGSGYVDSKILLWMFVIFLVGVGARMVYTYWEKVDEEKQKPKEMRIGIYVLAGVFSLGVGLVSGLLGIGGGILIVPFLLFVLKIPTKIAAGTASFVVVFSSLFGVAGHLAGGHFNIQLLIFGGIAVFIGANIGARLMVKTKPGFIKVAFGVLMWVFALQLVLKLIGYI